MRAIYSLFLLGMFSICGTIVSAAPPTTSPSLDIFQRRIAPIFNSSKPSSCAECHLSGVDLKDYIRPTQAQTFASLVKAGLVDVKRPQNSKILTFINRRPEKPSLVSDEIRKQEAAAFSAWLEAAASDPQLLKALDQAEKIGPSIPLEVVRHARNDRILASFLDNIWSEVNRCAPCHDPRTNDKQRKRHGEQVSWIKPNDPQGTLNYLLEAKLIDLNKPEASLLLTKPTLQVKHVGGLKMLVGDRSYQQMRRFIDDYAATVAGKYQIADQLPKPSEEVSRVSEIWLKITGVPEKFDKKLMQVDIYRWEASRWSPSRWATTDRPVFGPKQLWQHSLNITALRGTPRATEITAKPQLPAGKYLLKMYVDFNGDLQKNPQAQMDEKNFVGQMEIDSSWPAGYGKMTEATFPKP